MGSVSLNKLVVVGGCWLRNKVEHLVCIWNVGDFKQFGDEDLGEIEAISEGESMDLLHLIHNKALISGIFSDNLTIGKLATRCWEALLERLWCCFLLSF